MNNICINIDILKEMKKDYRDPVFVGEIRCNSKRVDNICFTLEKNPEGRLRIWEYPCQDQDIMRNRYVVAFYFAKKYSTCSVVVLDRICFIHYGRKEVVVAEWYGTASFEEIALLSSQLAKYYNNAYEAREYDSKETRCTGCRFFDTDYPQKKYMSVFNKSLREESYAYTEREKEIFDREDPIPSALSRGVALYYSRHMMQEPTALREVTPATQQP